MEYFSLFLAARYRFECIGISITQCQDTNRNISNTFKDLTKKKKIYHGTPYIIVNIIPISV